MITWDRSHDWVVERYFNERARLTIRFGDSPISAPELMALRRCLPQFRDRSPSSILAMIGDSGELALGEMPGREARRLIGLIEAEGLLVVAESASFVSYRPFDRTTGCAWLIEDPTEAARVAEAMISEGIPIQSIEA